MRTEPIYFILICLALVVASWFLGWLNEVYLFGTNVVSVMLFGKDIYFSADVTTITAGQHAYKLLTEVALPDNISIIESGAFKSNLLTKISLGSDVSLEKNAFGHGFEDFYNSNNRYAGTYTRKNIKSNEWTIWKDGFAYIEQNGTVIIYDYSGSVGDITIPSEINGKAVTTITNRAFYRKGLTGITIPNSVKEIEVDAFGGNSITKVIMPPNIILGGDGNREDILGSRAGFYNVYTRNKEERNTVYIRKSADTNSWSVSKE